MITYIALAIFIAVCGLMARTELQLAAGRDALRRIPTPKGGLNGGRRTTEQATYGRWPPFFETAAAVTLITFSAVRLGVGTDFELYHGLYNTRVDPNDWVGTFSRIPQEVGFTALSLTLRTVTDHPYAIFVLTSAACVIPVWLAARRASVDPSLSLLLYVLLAYYLSSMNIVRQGVAISFFLLATTYLSDSKWRYAALMAIGALFHSTIFVAIAIQLVSLRLRLNPRTFIAVGAVAVAIALSITQIPLVATLAAELNPRYVTYLSSEPTGIGTTLTILFRICLLAALALIARRVKLNDSDRQHFMYIYLSIALLIVGTASVPLGRMELYFSIFLLLLVPNIVRRHPRGSLLLWAIVATAAVYFVFSVSAFGGLIPYQTWVEL